MAPSVPTEGEPEIVAEPMLVTLPRISVSSEICSLPSWKSRVTDGAPVKTTQRKAWPFPVPFRVPLQVFIKYKEASSATEKRPFEEKPGPTRVRVPLSTSTVPPRLLKG